MGDPSNRLRNRLLLALPSSDLKRLMPELEHIRCQREQVLMDADSSLDHVFFPDSGVVSVVAVYEDAASLRWQRSVGKVARLPSCLTWIRVRPRPRNT